MIAKFLLAFSFLISSFATFSQNTFSLSDTTLEIGQSCVMQRIVFNMNNQDVIVDKERQPFLDSLVEFMLNFKNVTFEIGVHTGVRGNAEANMKASEFRARSLRFYLIDKGVDEENLVARAFGESDPIYTYDEINEFRETDKVRSKKMHIENSRVVLKVFSQAFPFKYTFDLSDSIFEVGETFTTHGIRFELNKPNLIIDEVTLPLLDSLVSFFKGHPKMRIELSWHNASLGLQDRSMNYCYHRARALYDYFVGQGISQTQLIPQCYGAEKPIHPDPYINQFKETDREKFHQLHRENRRLELKILEINIP